MTEKYSTAMCYLQPDKVSDVMGGWGGYQLKPLLLPPSHVYTRRTAINVLKCNVLSHLADACNALYGHLQVIRLPNDKIGQSNRFSSSHRCDI